MPSIQSIALLALAGTISAYAFEDEFSVSDLVARDAGNLLDNFDDLMEVYQRDIDGPYLEGQLLVRSAKGGSKVSKSSGGGGKPSSGKSSGGKSTAGKILKGAGKGASAFGDIGTGLTGISDVVGMFKGNGGSSGGANGQASPPPSRRDLEDSGEDLGLFVREARRRKHHGGPTFGGPTFGHANSAIGHGIPHGHSTFSNLEHGLNGISSVAGLFQGNGDNSNSNSKRDLESLLDDAFQIYVRELGLEDLEY